MEDNLFGWGKPNNAGVNVGMHTILDLNHLGEKKAAARLLSAIEAVVADKANHCPDLGGRATTRKVTDAVIAALKNSAVTPHSRELVTAGV